MLLGILLQPGCVFYVRPDPVGGDSGLPWVDAPAAGRVELLDRDVGGYEAATLSIEYATARDSELVHNDWDLLFGNDRTPGTDTFTVTMVVDDRSWIADLGPEVGLDEVPSDVRGTSEDVAVHQGHSYLVRTLDSETCQLALVRVVEHEVDHSVTVRWCRSVDTDVFRPDPSCY